MRVCLRANEHVCAPPIYPLRGVYADVQPRAKSADRSWQAMRKRWGEPSPGADVAGASPVSVKMWQRVSPNPVQMWQG